jgi:hypothetical protein
VQGARFSSIFRERLSAPSGSYQQARKPTPKSDRQGRLAVSTGIGPGKSDAQGNVPDEVYHPNTFVVVTYNPV